MNLVQRLLTVVPVLLIISCSTSYEVTMPYKNLDGYSGSRLFPVMANTSEFTFRAWISNSTSIDRIISISKDSGANYTGLLTEFGDKANGRRLSKYYNEIAVTPLSGFEEFRKRLDSLKIGSISSQPCCIPIVFDSPFSTYVIEIKTNNSYNCFRFDTGYPTERGKQDIYTSIQTLLFQEFDLYHYFKFGPTPNKPSSD